MFDERMASQNLKSVYEKVKSGKKQQQTNLQLSEQMPLVRSECLLMTSFTNNKSWSHTGPAQQDLSPLSLCDSRQRDRKMKNGDKEY